MKNYAALTRENVVVEIIVADFEWVEQNLTGDWHDLGPDPLTVAVGYVYDPATNTFSPPPIPKPLPDGD